MEEAEPIQLARKGDLEAYNILVLKYQDQVFNHSYGLLGNSDLAEDMAQDTFLLSFRKIFQFRGGSFRAWLLKIAINLCYDEMRTWKRTPTQPLELVNEDGEINESPYWIKDHYMLPEESVEMHEFCEAIERGLGELSLSFRIAVILVDIQQLDYKEAAAAMGTSTGTLKSRLARGRMMLRNFLLRMHAIKAFTDEFTKLEVVT
jgi:RNA polymerase sigma-70 factor, ECF subfamily